MISDPFPRESDTNLVIHNSPKCNTMANGTVVSQAEISALKDALAAQQKLLQNLYNELEAEREASATAASEALSVILRLQGEKAAVKMEAEQYKRLAEERMCHAEESFALIEDMITEKEMEVAELDYQVQTYRYQLMSMGFDVPAAGDDMKLPENLFHRTESLAGDTNLHLKCKKAMFELESSTSTADLDFMSKPHEEDHQLGQETNDFASDFERKVEGSSHGAMSSYAEQIKELELRVKQMTGANITGLMSEAPTPAISKRPSTANLSNLCNLANSYEPHKLEVVDEVVPLKHPDDSTKISEVVHSPRPTMVHDVFEVPQVDEESTSYEPSGDGEKEGVQDQAHVEAVRQMAKDQPKWVKKLLQSDDHEVDHESSSEDRRMEVCQASDTLQSQGQSRPESVKQIAKEEPDWLKKLLESTHHEKSLCRPSDVAAIDRGILQPTKSIDVPFVQPRTNVDLSEFNVHKHNTSPDSNEVGRPVPSSDREEELRLLKEIKEKLTLLQGEIALQKVKKHVTRDEPSLQPLAEMMVSFWL